MDHDIIVTSRNYVKSLIKSGGHDWDHTKRVLHLCHEIGQNKNADIFILTIASLFHDTGRELELKKGIPHEVASSDIAREYLQKQGVSSEQISQITHCIESHRFSNDVEPRTIEAKILSDADKLDALGAIGVIRTVQHGLKLNRGINGFIAHFHEKLLKLRDLMYTKTAKEIAQRRHVFLEEFLEQLQNELM